MTTHGWALGGRVKKPTCIAHEGIVLALGKNCPRYSRPFPEVQTRSSFLFCPPFVENLCPSRRACLYTRTATRQLFLSPIRALASRSWRGSFSMECFSLVSHLSLCFLQVQQQISCFSFRSLYFCVSLRTIPPPWSVSPACFGW